MHSVPPASATEVLDIADFAPSKTAEVPLAATPAWQSLGIKYIHIYFKGYFSLQEHPASISWLDLLTKTTNVSASPGKNKIVSTKEKGARLEMEGIETEKPLMGRPEKHQEVEQPLLHGRAGFLVTVAEVAPSLGSRTRSLDTTSSSLGQAKIRIVELFSQLSCQLESRAM